MTPFVKLILSEAGVVICVIIIILDIKVTRINYCDAIKKIRDIVYGRDQE